MNFILCEGLLQSIYTERGFCMNEEFEMMTPQPEEITSQMEETTPQPEEGKTAKEKKPHKWRKRIGKCLLLLAVLFVGFIGGIVFLISGSNSNINNLSILKKLLVLEGCVEQYYLDEADGDKMEAGIYRGYLSGLGDPYSTYYTEEEYNQMMEEDSGEYVGIGITVMKDTTTGYVSIEQVQKDAPAYNAGIQPGDLLIEVDGNDTTTLSLQEAVNLIKKGENKEVLLLVGRGTDTFEVTVEKTSVQIESVTYEMKEDNIGYIAVSQFIENTGDKFIDAVDTLEAQGMKSLIIDLRDNGGGFVDVCVDMVSRIIPEDQLIVYTEDKNGKKTEYKSNSEKELNIPIIILVNGNTASASEIMTGCLKDYGVANVVGSQTYGKGIVQNIIGLSDGSAIKLTVAKYYTPNGNDIHKKGIEPDVIVEMEDAQWKEARDDETKDTQLQKAYELLK